MGLRRRGRRGVLVCVIGLVLGCFVVSALIFGPWWRIRNLPTPEEWSALFGASALVALGLGWYQIRQVDRSNRELIASNELARQVNLETIRPRVHVYLHADRHVGKKRGGPSQGTVYIALANTGASQARNVRLTVEPPFDSLDEFFVLDGRARHFAEVNGVFDGTVRFDSIKPGASYVYFLGRTPELFEAEATVPQRYEITATYNGTGSQPAYRDMFTIDFAIERHLERPVDGLTRIGRDLEVIGDKIENLRQSANRIANASENKADQE